MSAAQAQRHSSRVSQSFLLRLDAACTFVRRCRTFREPRCKFLKTKFPKTQNAQGTFLERNIAELVRLSRTSIADEMREEHRLRVLGE
jgi:hypothetical protein